MPGIVTEVWKDGARWFAAAGEDPRACAYGLGVWGNGGAAFLAILDLEFGATPEH